MRITLPDLHQGRDTETQVYKLVNQLRRATNTSDSVSFHFYVNDTTNSGYIVPSSQIAITTPGNRGWRPSVDTIYQRAEITVSLISSTIIGGNNYTFSIVTNYGSLTPVLVILGTTALGTYTVSIDTGSTSASDTFALFVSSSSVATIEYTAVLRLYDQ